MKSIRNDRMLSIGVAVVAVSLLSPMVGLVPLVRAQQGDEIEMLRIRPNFYMIAGAGGNIGMQTGTDGVVLVNSGTADAAERVVAAIRNTTDQPIRYIINTSADADHVGGNAKLAKAGRSIFAMGPEPLGGAATSAMTNGFAASILAPEKVLVRMSAPTGAAAPFPDDALPTEFFAGTHRDLYFNDEGIQILRQMAAHSDGDSIVVFRRSDVVVAGDVLDATRFPLIDVARGGSIQGEIAALNRVLEQSVRPTPFAFEEVGTFIVPGHGRVYEYADVVEYRDMVVIIRDVIQDMIQRKMTLDQIKAASPTKPYDPQYGSKSGSWTTDSFVEAIYKSLTAKKP